MARTMEAVTGFALPATLKSRFDEVPDGKSKLEMPLWLVTASETEMGDGPSSTS